MRMGSNSSKPKPKTVTRNPNPEPLPNPKSKPKSVTRNPNPKPLLETQTQNPVASGNGPQNGKKREKNKTKIDMVRGFFLERSVHPSSPC